MKRLLAALLLVASPALSQSNGWREAANGWGEIQTPAGYSAIPAPTGCASGLVPYFNASLQLVCSPTVYAPATDTTTSTGTIAARNLTATALATPTITPPVLPVLSKFTTITVVAGASLADGDYFTLSDGSAKVFEFDSAPAGVTAGRVPITFTGAENAQAIRDLVVVAINGSGLNASAIAAAADTLTVTLGTPGSAGGVNSENVANAGFLVPVWGDPVHVTTYGYKVSACLASGACAPSAEVTTATGHATLSNRNYNSIAWAAVTGTSYYKLYRTTGTPSGGDAPPRLLYTGTALTFNDTNATSTSEAVAKWNETGALRGHALGAAATFTVCASNATHTTACDFLADGTADEVEIQAAIDALPATGGTVLLSDGTFNTAAQILTRFKLHLRGFGLSTIIKAASGTNRAIILAKNDATGKGATSGNYLTVTDLALDSNNLSGVHGISLWGYDAPCLTPRVERCWIRNGSGTAYGILTQNASDLYVAGSQFDTWGDSGIELRYQVRASIVGNTFSGSAFQVYADTSGANISSGISVIGNLFLNSTVSITPDGAVVRGYTFTGNTYRRSGGAGTQLYLRSVDGMVISDNTFENLAETSAGTTAMIVLVDTSPYARNVVIDANTFTLGTASSGVTSYPAITIAGSDGVTVSNNAISSPGTTTATGIQVTSANASGVVIRGNRIRGAGAGASRVGVSIAAATGVHVEGNFYDTLQTGVNIVAGATSTRVAGPLWTTSVTTPIANAGTATSYQGVSSLVPTYADNTAALAGGLVAGDPYRTSTGVLMVTY